MIMNVVTRFPPSPTGYLHIGSLRTALYNYFYARKHGGKFILRVEDTDRERYVDGAVESLIKTMDAMGIEYDEGPILKNGTLSEKGENGPYTQSERLSLYKTYVEKLLTQEDAYHCFCSKERLQEVREQQKLAKMQPKYDRACLKLSKEEVQAKLEADEAYVVRLRIPDGQTKFTDEIRGVISIENNQIDDQVLQKTDGYPTYHMAVVVDDHLMGVTHVIRGEEWISSVPKHIVLYQKLGFELPSFAHLPLILNADRSKLSKRQGDVAVEDFLSKGYLKDALINYVSLLGFNPSGDREIYSSDELKEAFELSKINKGGAVFDTTKLDWMNKEYIKAASTETVIELVKEIGVKTDGFNSEVLNKIIEVEKERFTLLPDFTERSEVYNKLPKYNSEILAWKKSTKEDAAEQLQGVKTAIEKLSDKSMEEVGLIEEDIKRYISSNELQTGAVLWPLRVALSGSEKSTGPFELLYVLGKEEGLVRITQAISSLT